VPKNRICRLNSLKYLLPYGQIKKFNLRILLFYQQVPPCQESGGTGAEVLFFIYNTPRFSAILTLL
jgi:hypothetical protein